VPGFERLLVDEGLVDEILVLRYPRQHTRFAIRQIDPVRQWAQPTDIALLDKWEAHTAAKVAMFQRLRPRRPDRDQSNDKKRAHGAMRSLLAKSTTTARITASLGIRSVDCRAPADMRETGPGRCRRPCP
jgi:polyphosphate kinase 2 (PPK2 family)